MTPPVSPVEGHLYFLFTEYENTINIRKWSKEPFYGAQEYVPVGELERLRAALKAHEVQWNRLQDAIAGMEKTMEAHGIDHFKWQPMTFDETLQGNVP